MGLKTDHSKEILPVCLDKVISFDPHETVDTLNKSNIFVSKPFEADEGTGQTLFFIFFRPKNLENVDQIIC